MNMSNARIYVFGTSYKGAQWFDILAANELSGMIANVLKHGVPELEFKNMQFINDYKEEEYKSEIHINKLKYKERRILTRDDIKTLRSQLRGQLKKVNNFIYEQVHVVNDEFSKKPSTGFLTEDMLYV